MGGKMPSDFQLMECANKKQQLVDRISLLPNEVLVDILSLLTFEEAVRTSVLSQRWLDLWKFIRRIDLDGFKPLDGIVNDKCLHYKSKRHKYVAWVNKVLRSHKAMVLDVFRIHFDLNKFSRYDIDKWLQYAFERRVHKLELNFLDYFRLPSGGTMYSFPHDLLGLSSGNVNPISLSGYCGNSINSHACFKSLTALTLKNVDLSEKVVQYFLHNCHFLEYLVLESTGDLEKIEVCGPSLSLKHLDVRYCPVLRSLVVCDTNIVSLKITEGRRLVLKNVPMLVDVFVTGMSYGNLVGDVVSWLSCCLFNLEVLTLQVNDMQVRKEKTKDVAAVPELTRLKHFTLVSHAARDDSLLAFTSLIRASPNLEKFTLKLNWLHDIARKRRKSKKAVTFPLQHLEAVELCGYYGRTAEVELVEYLLENAVALKRITVDPRDQPPFGTCLDEPAEDVVAIKLAREQLQRLVPSQVELVFL